MTDPRVDRFALRGARVLFRDVLCDEMAVIVLGDSIEDVVAADEIPRDVPVRELCGGVLAPGFIDTQVNGGGGVLFNKAPTVETVRRIGAAHRRFGTTGFLPTLISDDAQVVERAVRAVESARAEGVPGVLGIHLEGPMLSPFKAGIHDAAKFVGPEEALVASMVSMLDGATIVTLAPEQVGVDTIARLAAAGVLVAIGHTNASYEETREALDAGARGFTHLFNAMTPFTSRAPGALGAALEDRESWCGLIVDGVHVHPAALRVALSARPVDRFMLVTDAMPPVGTDDAFFDLQGRRIRVTEGGYLGEDGTLAGSALDMASAVRNAVELLGLPLATALQAAARFPAAFLRDETRGVIASGLKADLVWLDDALMVQETWIAGMATDAAASARTAA